MSTISNEKPIRVGMLRCDTHAMWYAPLMAQHDPKALQNPTDPAEDFRYSWQSGGIHMFFYTRYGHPLEMTAPYVGGFQIAKVWDEDRRSAEMMAKIFRQPPQVCDTPEEASRDVDLVFVADCNGDGGDHVQLAGPGLKRGIPTFVDKPFADTVAHCRELQAMAKASGAPLLSLSILQTEPSVTLFKNRMPEVGTLNFATLAGYGTHPAGLVHTFSTIHHLYGPGIHQVQVMKAQGHTAYHVSYGPLAGKEGRPIHGVMVNCDVGNRPFTALGMSAFGTKEDIHAMTMGDYAYPYGTAIIIRKIAQMVRERTVEAALIDNMVEAIAAIEAFKASAETGKAARVADFLKNAGGA